LNQGMEYLWHYQTAIGAIGILERERRITNLFFETDPVPDGAAVEETELLREAGRQLQEYLLGRRKAFELPLAPSGTAFMRRVWDCLTEIPYGATRSYREVAASTGNGKACRAVGLANHCNPIPVFIPCHRVIGANGGLTGYRGGLAVKSFLLELERGHF